jgi:hypothetical protein
VIASAASRPLRVATYSAIGTTIAIAAGAFVLSFAALSDLAVQAGQPEELAWIWPVIVDGAILQATISVVALAPRSGALPARRFFWAVLTVAASVSVAGNALHAAVSTGRTLAPLIGAAVATVAPVSLLAATHGLALLVGVPNAPADGGALETSEAGGMAHATTKPETAPQEAGDTAGFSPPPADIEEKHAPPDSGAPSLAVTLKNAGWSNRRIGLHLGVHHKTVGRMLAKAAEATDTDLGTPQFPDLLPADSPTGDTTTEGKPHAHYR